MEECKHCGSVDGYYVMAIISGRGAMNYNFDNTWHKENGHMHDYLNYKEQKTMFCIECRGRLGIKKD